MTKDTIQERLGEEAQRLSALSFRQGDAGAGIAANVAEEARARIDALEADVARLREELSAERSGHQAALAGLDQEGRNHWAQRERADAAETENARLTARIAKLEEVLKPFADAGRLLHGSEHFWVYWPASGNEYRIGSDDLRRASEVLE